VSARARDLPLTVSAVVGALVLAGAAGLAATDSRPVAFRSGSMAPAIPTGSVALVHRVPADQLSTGDVVTVRSGGSFVTHRIVALSRSGDSATLQLRGDANGAPDPEVHSVGSAERVVASVPWLGYLLGGLSGWAGLLLAGVYVAWLLRRIVGGPPVPAGSAPEPRHRVDRRRRSSWRAHRRLTVGAALTALALCGSVVAGAPRAWAAWGDSVAVSGTTFRATTVPPPATFTCGGLGVLSVTFNWSPVAGATSYDLHFGSNGSQVVTVTGTSRTVTSALSNGTAWVQARVPYAGTTWTSAPSATRTYTVALVSLCS
jgi:signal peptidase I